MTKNITIDNQAIVGSRYIISYHSKLIGDLHEYCIIIQDYTIKFQSQTGFVPSDIVEILSVDLEKNTFELKVIDRAELSKSELEVIPYLSYASNIKIPSSIQSNYKPKVNPRSGLKILYSYTFDLKDNNRVYLLIFTSSSVDIDYAYPSIDMVDPSTDEVQFRFIVYKPKA